MSVRDEIASILAEPLVTRINFSLGGLAITGAGLGRVRNAILHDRIRVVPDPSLPAGAGGSYNATQNQIGVEPSLTQQHLASSIQMRSVLLHECSHALVDLSRAAATTILSDEAAAYLVQLMYRLGRGQSWLRTWASQNQGTPTGRIFHEAIRIIDRFALLQSCAILQLQAYSALRQAIQQHPVYRGTSSTALTRADGI
ncbi:MAG: hypothetical protein D6736_04285 [Nitrospinota bacterium]|nr:MAG: hypothetical protein D6736_04285 [Nitrospinota bacterium]